MRVSSHILEALVRSWFDLLRFVSAIMRLSVILAAGFDDKVAF